MDKYQRFLVENVETVATVENALRTLLFFMPGRLRDSQLKLEAAYSALGLVSWFNDLSIINYLTALRQKVRSPTSPLRKITVGDTPENLHFPPREAVPFATWLTFIRFVELLIELVAKTTLGRIWKYKAALAVESIKCMLKLWLLLKMNGRMLLQNYLYLPQLRDIETIKLYAKEQLTDANRESKHRKRLSISPAKMEIFREQTGMDKTQNGAREQPTLLGPLLGGASATNPSSSSNVTAELLHILRPIVYLISILRYGEKSWIPIFASLGVDVSSLGLYYRSKLPLSEVQQFEVTRRSMLLSFYLLRNPIFQITLRVLGGGNSQEKNGFFGKLMATVRDYISIYQEQYFYTSAT